MVQAMDAGAEMERRSEGLLADRYSAQRRRKNMSLMTNTCVNLLSQGASFAALLWCGTKLLRGQLSFGSLTAVTQLVSQIQAPVMNLSAVIPQYIAMSAAAERLKELSELLEVHPKTLERHRKYLVACAVALNKEYRCIMDYILSREGDA